MTPGEKAVWAGVFALRWEREREDNYRGHSERDAGRRCALHAARAVEGMRDALIPVRMVSDEVPMDDDAAEMLSSMLEET